MPQHISRIVWKPINWWPESPDQYPDGLPPVKPESLHLGDVVPGHPGLNVVGFQMGDMILVRDFGESITLPLGDLTSDEDEEPQAWRPEAGPRAREGRNGRLVVALPAVSVPDTVDALVELYWTATGESPASGMPHIERIDRKPLDDRPARGGPWVFVDLPDDGSSPWLELATQDGAVALRIREYGDGLGDDDVTVSQLVVPLSVVPIFADALLYIHRRTREHDYQGPDDGLPPEGSANAET